MDVHDSGIFFQQLFARRDSANAADSIGSDRRCQSRRDVVHGACKGIAEVMFADSIVVGILFLIGIAIVSLRGAAMALAELSSAWLYRPCSELIKA